VIELDAGNFRPVVPDVRAETHFDSVENGSLAAGPRPIEVLVAS
jgi:hypothetical protein